MATSEKLALTWIAQFKDGSLLKQFDDKEQTVEHKFEEVQKRQDDLKIFHVINVKTNHIYQVDLELGRFHFLTPGTITPPEDFVAGDTEHKYRLIFFRRWQRDVEWNPVTNTMREVSAKVKYVLGYQYTTPDGKNVKRMSQITENDEVYLV